MWHQKVFAQSRLLNQECALGAEEYHEKY